MEITPVTLKQANTFIKQHHRHHKPVTNGYRFCLGVIDDRRRLCGVAIVGNPLSQYLQNGLTAEVWLFPLSEPMKIRFTAEVRRTCTDGTKNANSMLYGACWRAAKAMGFRRLITYSLQEESGASLRAAGWTNEGLHGGGDWDVDSRHRQPSLFQERKYRWSIGADGR